MNGGRFGLKAVQIPLDIGLGFGSATTMWVYELVDPVTGNAIDPLTGAPTTTPVYNPTILAQSGMPISVNWSNGLPAGPHILPVDPTLLMSMGTNTSGASFLPQLVAHLHGGHSAAIYDGYPTYVDMPGESTNYRYDNSQQGALIWYHDHTMGLTRLNVYAGLAGGYKLTINDGTVNSPGDTNGDGVILRGEANYNNDFGAAIALESTDLGPQDTVWLAPGQGIKVIATFDRPGDYVWHCHILSHEDHDMMRPFKVIGLTGDFTGTAAENGTVTTGLIEIGRTDPMKQGFVAGTFTGTAGLGTLTLDGNLVMADGMAMPSDNNGEWSYATNAAADALAQGEHVSDVLTISEIDGTSHTVTIDVVGVNDAPVVAGAVAITSQFTSARMITAAELLAKATDVDHGAVLNVTGLTASSGQLVDQGDGTWIYYAAPGTPANVTLSYQVSDGLASVAGSATLTLSSAAITQLNGSAGADTLDGGAGTDAAVYTSATKSVIVNLTTGTATGGAGTDKLIGIENVVGGAAADTLTGDLNANFLSGGAGNDIIDGSLGDDFLLGGLGNDTLKGGAGHDVLVGGLGRDTFLFNTYPATTLEADRIMDFSHAEHDLLRFSRSVFSGFSQTGTLSADAFYSASGARAAHDSTDRVIYDPTSGKLFYDSDGTGAAAATLVAVLGASTAGAMHPDVSWQDILITV